MSEPYAETRRAARLAEPIFSTNQWTWGDSEKLHVPSAQEIEATIHSLIVILLGGENEVSTGRLLVKRGIAGAEIYIQVGSLDGVLMEDQE